MPIRLVGTCPVCERQQKVTPEGRMVHHGFRRPGRGHIFGDCFGVHKPAYELSSAGCESYRKELAYAREIQKERLERLRARPETVSVEGRNYKIITYRRDAEDPREQQAYERAIQYEIGNAEFAIREIDRRALRMTQLIEQWAPAPLIEIDEEGFTPAKRQERAERQAERDTKRAERERKRQELQNKRNERLAKRATQLLFFFDEFERLAAQPPSVARDVYARDLVFEMSKTKYGIRYPQDLWNGPDDGYGNHTPGPWGDGMVERASQALVELHVGSPWEHRTSRGHFRADPIIVSRSSGNKIRVPEPDGPAEEILEQIAARPKY